MTDDNEIKPATVFPKFDSPEERWAWMEAEAEKRGFKKAPPDHPIYSEGATITFITSRPTTKKPPRK